MSHTQSHYEPVTKYATKVSLLYHNAEGFATAVSGHVKLSSSEGRNCTKSWTVYTRSETGGHGVASWSKYPSSHARRSTIEGQQHTQMDRHRLVCYRLGLAGCWCARRLGHEVYLRCLQSVRERYARHQRDGLGALLLKYSPCRVPCAFSTRMPTHAHRALTGGQRSVIG